MMRSMYAGVSGLRTHQTKMDVIGNNIANVNTVGYKKSQIAFQDLLSQAIRGASAPTAGGLGGTNPQQIGLGVTLGEITTVHTEGSTQTTNSPTDLKINGNGYFVVSPDGGTNNFYTRAGNFKLDRAGNLLTSEGLRVMGYGFNEDGTPTTTRVPIQINLADQAAPTATKDISFEGTLNSAAAAYKTITAAVAPLTVPDVETKADNAYYTDMVIKDSKGNSYNATYKFERSVLKNPAAAGTAADPKEVSVWEMKMTSLKPVGSTTSILPTPAPDYFVKFDNTGKILGLAPAGTPAALKSLDTLDVTANTEMQAFMAAYANDTNFTVKDFNVQITKDGVDFGQDVDLDKNGTIDPLEKGLINFDMSKIKEFGIDTSIKGVDDMGSTAGTITGFSIGSDGVVIGIYSNGDKKPLSQVLLAKFDNPSGLEKKGGNLFTDTPNSGAPTEGRVGASGFGTVTPGTLEMSNVDLSMEFTEMITAQRGFQANSRIITTTDEMLQELVNLKR